MKTITVTFEVDDDVTIEQLHETLCQLVHETNEDQVDSEFDVRHKITDIDIPE